MGWGRTNNNNRDKGDKDDGGAFENVLQKLSVPHIVNSWCKSNPQWKALPSFKIARSGFPTIFSSENKLVIVGGKCPSNIKHHCNKEEVLYSEKCNWIITNDTIKSIRYNHNSEDVTKICH